MLLIPGVWSNQESGSIGVQSGVIAFLTRVLFEIYVNINLYFYGVVNSRNKGKGKYSDTRKEFQPLSLKHQSARKAWPAVKQGRGQTWKQSRNWHVAVFIITILLITLWTIHTFSISLIFKRDFQTNENYWHSHPTSAYLSSEGMKSSSSHWF